MSEEIRHTEDELSEADLDLVSGGVGAMIPGMNGPMKSPLGPLKMEEEPTGPE